MKFQVNQKVIALNNPLSPRSQHRSKGNIYTVTALSWCAGCGINFINIDETRPRKLSPGSVHCNDCNHIQPNNLAWAKADLFAPLTEESMEALAESEEYELAAIVRDNLNLIKDVKS